MPPRSPAVSSPVAGPSVLAQSPLRLQILDDFFPNQLSGFRIAEFNHLFRVFPNARCHTISRDFPTAFLAYARRYPQFADRVTPFLGGVPDDTEVIYCVGLNTAAYYLPFIELQGIPFVVELYPGFGLRLDEPISESSLDTIVTSRCFRKMIVTQSNALAFVQRRYHLAQNQLVYKYGFVADDSVWPDPPRSRQPDGRLELAFVAHKYTPAGRDKGYDVFIDMARQLAGWHPGKVGFHVVGPWGPQDYSLGHLRPGRDIFFHGSRTQPFFRVLHQGVDAVVSPNRANVFGPGSFDGFPTASVLDAMLCGAAAFVTDPLRLNHHFKADRELVLIEPNAELAAGTIRRFSDAGEMAHVGEAGRRRARAIFGLEAQMAPRVEALISAASMAAVGRAALPASH